MSRFTWATCPGASFGRKRQTMRPCGTCITATSSVPARAATGAPKAKAATRSAARAALQDDDEDEQDGEDEHGVMGAHDRSPFLGRDRNRGRYRHLRGALGP